MDGFAFRLVEVKGMSLNVTRNVSVFFANGNVHVPSRGVETKAACLFASDME